MKKTETMFRNKKCPCCGKLYPPKTDQERCTCERGGWLLSVEDLYQPKVKGGRV